MKLDAAATAHSSRNALALAQASRLAYLSETEITDTVRTAWNWPRAGFFSTDRDTQCFVAARDDAAVLAFRGTENLSDWKTNSRFIAKGGPLGKTHRGFLAAWQSIAPAVEAALQDADIAGRPLWITGHSLGGGLAVVAAAAFIEKGRPVQGLYTYGQPRVGDNDFVREFDRRFPGRYFRYVNNTDLVPRVPPWSFGYRHAGHLRYFDADGRLHDSLPFWKRLLDRLEGRIESIPDKGLDAIQDHSRDQYVALCERA